MRECLLDSSFVIDLRNEMAAGQVGPALGWLRRNEFTVSTLIRSPCGRDALRIAWAKMMLGRRRLPSKWGLF
jgi:hypothetical protein